MEFNDQRSRTDEEHYKLMKVINFRFPHQYKKLGLTGAVLILIFLIGYKFYGSNDIMNKDILRTIMLLFLLVASLSKDSFEDEYISYLRGQSYVLASICAIAYSIGLPLVALVMDMLITKITDGDGIQFYEVSAFEVMFMLLCFQILFFEVLKRLGRAQ